jgi:hypothetical protein
VDDINPRLICELCGVSRRYLQRLVDEGLLIPRKRGQRFRESQIFDVMAVVGVSYGQAFKAAGADPFWRDEAVRFVAGLSVAELLAAVAEGKTFVALAPPGAVAQSQLIVPQLRPNASRADRLMLAQLDLQKVYWRTLRQLHEVVGVELGPAPQPPLDL